MEDWVFFFGIETRRDEQQRRQRQSRAGRVRLSCHAAYCSWGNLERYRGREGAEAGAGAGTVAESFKYGFCIKLQFKLTFEWKVIA